MLNIFLMHASPGLQSVLLRKSVTMLSRSCVRCSACGRTPLTGEQLHVFTESQGEKTVCSLCISTHPDGEYGTVLRSERVHANAGSLRRLAA